MKISKLIYIGTMLKLIYKVNAVNRFHVFSFGIINYNSLS